MVVTAMGSITRLDETSGDIIDNYTFGSNNDQDGGSRIGPMIIGSI